MTRLLHGFSTDHRWHYTLESEYGQALHLGITMSEIDHRTAATHAFVYACWLADLEIVMQIVRDLGEIIDVNRQVCGRNAIEWAAQSFQSCMGYAFQEGLRASAVNVCRYLVITFGSKINANGLTGSVLGACANGGYTDLVAYLVTKYGADLHHSRTDIFAMLVKRNYDTEAESYLHLFHDRLTSNPYGDVLLPSARGSIQAFKIVLDMFGSKLDAGCINDTFSTICKAHAHDKVRLALNMWADQLAVDMHLISRWYASHQTRLEKRYDLATSHGLTGQLIIDKCVDLLQTPGIQVALVLCCLPQNLELVDTVIDHYLDQIRKDPSLVRHAVIECLSLEDIDMFTHIITRCGPVIYPMAFQYACEAGDLEAVSVLLELGSEQLGCTSEAFISACMRGDADVAELLIRFVNIDEPSYRKAFRGACYNNHRDVVMILSACRNSIDFRPDTNYDLDLRKVKLEIIDLLNSIFGTDINSAMSVGNTACSGKRARTEGFLVEYKNNPRIWYKLN